MPEKWSKKEILGHLIDSAINNLTRLIRGTYEKDFKHIYEQDNWVSIQRYQQSDVKDLIELWTQLNKQFVRVLNQYPNNRATAFCDTGKISPNMNTMERLASLYVKHLKHHIYQICE